MLRGNCKMLDCNTSIKNKKIYPRDQKTNMKKL